MSPDQHLMWFDENIAWFESLPVKSLTARVPNCPGWNVQDVVNHLTFGLGISYPVALSKGPETSPSEVFSDVEWPDQRPSGEAAITAFSSSMRSCTTTFAATSPERPCWTYEGAGTAAFWFRRAAVETALHRIDVEEAVPAQRSPVAPDRLADALAETFEFTLPLAAAMTTPPDGRLVVSIPSLDVELAIGRGNHQATVTGDAQDILCALWGRNRDRINLAGDFHVAAGWMSLIEIAFAGR